MPKRAAEPRLFAVAGRLLFALIAASGALFVAELVSRRLAPARSPLEQLYQVRRVRMPRPYSMFAGQPGAPGLNALGYRGAVPAMPKPAGEVRLFFLGGSTVFRGLPPIAQLVEARLRQAGHDGVRCYNFGVVSSVSGMELARLLFELVGLAPDVVVMYNGGNDILVPHNWDPRPGYPFNFVAYERNPILDSELGDYPAVALALYGSNLARHVSPDYFLGTFVDLDGLRDEVGYGTAAWEAEIADTYVGNLASAARISDAFGADFIAFFQPMIEFKHSLADTEQRFAAADRSARVRRVRDLIRERVQARGDDELRFVDLSDLFVDETDDVFVDGIHIRQEFKPTVADALVPSLQTLVVDVLSERRKGL